MLKRLGADRQDAGHRREADENFALSGAQHRRRDAGGEQPRHRARRDGHVARHRDARALEKLQESLG